MRVPLILSLGRIVISHLVRRDGEIDIINSQNHKVQFQLSSTDPNIVNYAKTRHALKLATIFLENVFDFNQQIVIRIRRISPCKENNECAYGLAGTTRSLIVGYDGITYPQALIKQIPLLLAHVPPEKMHPSDINIKFNWEYEHYFPVDYPAPVSKHQYDFMHILVHEINHGLGMTSCFQGFNYIYPTPYQEASIEPEFIYHPTIFDQHMYDAVTHMPISKTLKSIEPVITPNRRSQFENITLPFRTKGRLVFPSIFGNNITLDASETVYLKQSPSHLSNDYLRTKDDMMRARGSSGAGIQDYIFNYPNWHYSPYGPSILDIHATLGYTLKVPDPTRSLQYYYWFKNRTRYEEPFEFSEDKN